MTRVRFTRPMAAITASLLPLFMAPVPAHANGSLGTIDNILISPLGAMPAMVIQWITLGTRADNIKVSIVGAGAGNVHEVSMFSSPCPAAGSSGPWTCSGGNTNDKIKIVYFLSVPTPAPTESMTTVTATGGFNGATYSASGTLIVRPVVDLGISATYQTGTYGTRAKLSVPVSNYGPDTSHTATVTITIVGDASGASSFPGCSQSGSTISCTVERLNFAETQPYTFTFRDSVPPTARRFTATVKGAYVDPNKGNNTATTGYGNPSGSNNPGPGGAGGNAGGVGASTSMTPTSASSSPGTSASPTSESGQTTTGPVEPATPEPANAAETANGTTAWIWPALVVVLLALTAGATAVLRRRRRAIPGSADEEPTP